MKLNGFLGVVEGNSILSYLCLNMYLVIVVTDTYAP
jgi:hypothetical protein